MHWADNYVLILVGGMWAAVVLMSAYYTAPYGPIMLLEVFIGVLFVPFIYYARKRKSKYVRMAFTVYIAVLSVGAVLLHIYKILDTIGLVLLIIVLFLIFDHATSRVDLD